MSITQDFLTTLLKTNLIRKPKTMDDLFGKIVEESAKIISGRVEAQYQDDSKKAAEKKAAEEERSKAGHPEDDVFKDIIKREL